MDRWLSRLNSEALEGLPPDFSLHDPIVASVRVSVGFLNVMAEIDFGSTVFQTRNADGADLSALSGRNTPKTRSNLTFFLLVREQTKRNYAYFAA